MSSIPEPHPDPAHVRARDEAATSELVSAFLATKASKAADDAREIRTLAAAAALVDEQRSRLTSRASLQSDMPARTMVAELAVAARVSERTVQRQLDEAADLCDRFTPVVEALDAARISRAHVGVIHDAGFAIQDDGARAEFVVMAIAQAETMTPGRLRPILQVVAARLDTRTVQERHDEARAQRMVRLVDRRDGLSDLTLTGEAVLVHGIYDRVTQDAHAVIAARPAREPDGGGAGGPGAAGAVSDVGAAPDTFGASDGAASSDAGPALSRGAGADAPAAADTADDSCADDVMRDDRTMDQLRADIVTDLLLTGTPQSCAAGEGIETIRATVQITIPVLTAVGASDEPAVLAGFGPIDPDTARRLAAGATGWERVMTSPATGEVLAVDRYRCTADMKRFLWARDERCRFPGCRQPVWRCDLDHTVDAAHGGPTSCRNLAHLCKRHHILKHNSHWTVRQLEAGVLEWTSPTGRVYTDVPDPIVRFMPEPARRRMDFRDPSTWVDVDEGDPPGF
ncbi:DUF222 domain-containing protein [Microbacterium sp. B2969]|uniref:DUF222 domain-containing protein n=1 Tax=Microbacterium alkaliflavum TaxID=3248839 RepID=A0ABW7Q6L7_9MICO